MVTEPAPPSLSAQPGLATSQTQLLFPGGSSRQASPEGPVVRCTSVACDELVYWKWKVKPASGGSPGSRWPLPFRSLYLVTQTLPDRTLPKNRSAPRVADSS